MKVNKAVILAGGLGTRISEETVIKPKPMLEIGGYPLRAKRFGAASRQIPRARRCC